MRLGRLLELAGIPLEGDLSQEALGRLEAAKIRSKGLLWSKLKTRLWYGPRLAKKLTWYHNRLIDVDPSWAKHDIAPMANITANGDNGPWEETPSGGRPLNSPWMNSNPDSDEYREAVKANYWKKGHHPRSTKARKAWYRRNGGELLAWERGVPVDMEAPVEEWRGIDGRTEVQVVRKGDAWILNSWKTVWKPKKISLFGSKKLTIPGLVIKGRRGFEIDNIFQEINGERVQAWFPITGFELRAPVTWAVFPRLEKPSK